MNRHIYIIGGVLLVMLSHFFMSCNDDKYSVDPAYRLSFSTDTVSFDTVFTTIGSATFHLKVYNRNDKGVNVNSVRLASGGSSGFMINVPDGYGDASAIEIPKNDSLYIFIEVKVDPQNRDNPILIKDSLIFQLASGVQQDVKLLAYGQDILIMKGKVIDKDTTLTAYRPILVYDSLRVNEGMKLTMEAGTRLYFHNKINCLVYGSVIANGTKENPVVLRGDRLDKMKELDLPYDRVSGQWGGVRFFEQSYDNYLNYVDIHGGQYGIQCDSSDVERTKLVLENSVVHNVKGNALDLISSKALVGNSQITNAGGYCVSVLGGEVEFIHCTVANFYSWDIRKGTAVFLGNSEHMPLTNAMFRNCLITGSMSDEMSGGRTKDESIPFNYEFSYSLVNTKLDEKSPGYQEELSYYPNTIWDEKEDDKGKSLAKDKNFLYIGKEDFDYDFRIDSLSAAVNLGAPEYAKQYPLDRNGRDRLNDGGPDVGCYEWMPGDKRRE